ncbi:hypothetical protein DFP74_2648 [Nocardiopsis sp. Huas11]|uniref:esterase-like activity of phytase family protein n=1 Tax=Nocardiopsis sp. Huas11 TaxID=2183912 RepID=UPI000EACB502|nr:esterase-like activity of phytase family protein [Nocardiopsis sp. Huas11]RKS06998.1 hypothetical protein DFP74_2648 [Nocardiopsis sp. Huas11]
MLRPIMATMTGLAGILVAVPAVAAERAHAPEIELLGEVRLPTGHQVEGTEMGGISGLAYDAEADRFLAISDDRSDRDDARFYELSLDLADGDLVEGDVDFTGVTTLRGADGRPYPQGTVDPEGIALDGDGDVYVSSEGDAGDLVSPSVHRYTRDGASAAELPVPRDYAPTADGDAGIRDNLAFESLTLTPSGRRLVTATENALVQDGEAATLEAGSRSRILEYHTRREQPKTEYVYETDPIPDAPVPAGGHADNGLVELLALDDTTFLALERSYSQGVGNDVRIYEVSTRPADRIRPGRAVTETPAVTKTLVANIEDDFGVAPDNLEGMALGPDLPDGRRTLVMVSDNNFSAGQVTQFLAFAIDQG